MNAEMIDCVLFSPNGDIRVKTTCPTRKIELVCDSEEENGILAMLEVTIGPLFVIILIKQDQDYIFSETKGVYKNGLNSKEVRRRLKLLTKDELLYLHVAFSELNDSFLDQPELQKFESLFSFQNFYSWFSHFVEI